MEALSQAYTRGMADAALAASHSKAVNTVTADQPTSVLGMLRAELGDMPPAPKGPGFQGIGAPSAVPNGTSSNPNEWSKDQIAMKRADGTFLSEVKAYRQSMSGGRGGLFPVKNFGKGK